MATYARKYSLEPVEVPRVRTRNRRIVTRLPVPESLPLFERMERFEPASMQGQPPVMIHRAKGWHVEDRWGNRWLDWSTGVLIANAGNGNPAIVAALRRIIRRPLLSTYVFPHADRALLVEELAALAPQGADHRSASSPEGAPQGADHRSASSPEGAPQGADWRVFLLSTGSEATENCIKLAKTWGLERHGPERRVFVSFRNGFHGRTMGAQLAGGMDGAKRWLGRLDDSFVQVPFPDGYKNPDTRFELFLETLAAKGVRAEQVCGVMAESYQGVGPDFMPVDYARRLEEWCRKHDVVLVMDEVQAGFCRTGTWFAFEQYGITPDLIACGKGISSSLPLSAVIGRADIMGLYPPGSMTSTHSGSPLPVAAALANVRELRRGPYLANARELGPVLREGLLAIQRRHPAQAGCVQARGLVAGIQIVKPGTREPDGATALRVNLACFHKGLLMFAPVGVAGECIKIAPPLDTSREALDEGLAVLGEAMDEVLG
jgi:4-aminobutyrate aminotransferase / (S)-3-amino-2-methylpropionate transaminase / 5-aminovalerate transaminase